MSTESDSDLDPRQALVRQFALAAVSGIMPHACDKNWGPEQVSELAWAVAYEMVDAENRPQQPEPPPQPQPQTRGYRR